MQTPARGSKPRLRAVKGGGDEPPAKDPSELPALYSEQEMATAFVRAHGDDWRYVAAINRWARWDDERGCWRFDRVLEAFELGKRIAVDFATRAINDDRLGPAYGVRRRLAATIESARTIAGVERIARSNSRIAMEPEAFDREPWVLNTPKGVIDLRSGDIRPCRRDDYLMMLAGTAPEPGPRPIFERLLREVTLEDEQLADYLQVLLGYTLTGDTSLHVLPFLWGAGRNGKSTLLDLVLRIMGDYARKIPSQTLLSDGRGNRHPTEIANLKGVRLAIASEVSEGTFWDEARIKELTGDEHLSARFMRGDFFSFRRTHVLLVAGNHRPQLRVVDTAMRSRMKLIPFRACFAGREDPDLPRKLQAELGQILAWLIEGAMRWHDEKRLPACAAVDAETAGYFDAQSTLDMWIGERCDTTDPDAREKAGALYADYKAWKEARGEHPVSQTRWGEQMLQRFRRIKSDGFKYQGIALHASSADLFN